METLELLLSIILLIHEYMKQKLWTPFYENCADGGVWNLAHL